jgi:hypothetical protein
MFLFNTTKNSKYFMDSIQHRKYLIKSDLNKNDQCSVELHRTLIYLQIEHQKSINQILKHYFQNFLSGEILKMLFHLLKKI